MLVGLAAVILWMGIGSPFFTQRFAADCKAVLKQMNRNVMQEVSAPLPAVPAATGTSVNSTERRRGR